MKIHKGMSGTVGAVAISIAMLAIPMGVQAQSALEQLKNQAGSGASLEAAGMSPSAPRSVQAAEALPPETAARMLTLARTIVRDHAAFELEYYTVDETVCSEAFSTQEYHTKKCRYWEVEVKSRLHGKHNIWVLGAETDRGFRLDKIILHAAWHDSLENRAYFRAPFYERGQGEIARIFPDGRYELNKYLDDEKEERMNLPGKNNPVYETRIRDLADARKAFAKEMDFWLRYDGSK